MHHVLISIICALLYNRAICGAVPDWNKELDDISSKLSEISIEVKIVGDKISNEVNILNKKLDGISRKVESQSAEITNVKKSLDDVSGSLTNEKEEVKKLVKKIDSYSEKQLRDQQFTKDALNAQKSQLQEIKNLTVVGFSKALEKLLAVSNGGELLSNISEGIKKLAKVYSQQEAKLNSIEDYAQQATNSINRAKADSTNKLENLRKNISMTLNEQRKPLSSSAETQVNRAVALSNIILKEMNILKDLEPKLIHVSRLSENMRNELTDHNLSPLANNLTNSLKALKTSTPQTISKLSKNLNALEIVLLALDALSNENDCPADLTLEIRDHHNEILKYLNSTKSESTPGQNADDETWKQIMKKLENIEKASEDNGSINDRLIRLRNDINDVRKSLEKSLGESEPDDDLVFG